MGSIGPRVLIVHLWLATRGGPPKVIANMAKCLEELGYEVEILSLAYNPRETFEDLLKHKVHTILPSSGQHLLNKLQQSFMRRFRRLQPYVQGVPINIFITPIVALAGYVKHRPDIIVLNGGNVFACIVKLLTRREIILYYHGLLEAHFKDTFLAKILQPIEKTSLKYCTPCMVSKEMSVTCWKAIGIKPLTLYPGINIESLTNLPRKDDGRTILYIGRIAPYRKQHILIEALKRVKHSVPEAKLILAGSLKLSDVHYYHYLRESIKEQKLDKHITIRVNVSDSDMLDLYSKASIYVNPSTETFGLNVVEALAAGLPAIVYSKGAQTEIVRHGVEGFYFRDLSECVFFLSKLLMDRNLRKTMSVNARKRAVLFSTQAFKLRLKSLLRGII